MALFSRKHRAHDDGLVHLGSTHHRWWTGETLPGDDVVVDAELLEPEPWSDGDDAPAAIVAGIADALEEFGYGDADRPHADQAPLAEVTLFARDGLPAEDRLGDLLGALGLEKDAGWVDIAAAHRRLAPATGPAEGEEGDDAPRRAANQAYACLRLFHH